jgi:DNA primase small subunit
MGSGESLTNNHSCSLHAQPLTLPATMPHSTSLGDSDSPMANVLLKEDTTEQSRTDEGIIQASGSVDQDMTMADVQAVDDEVPNANAEIKSEVKLEDLFADMDSDDEFSSSNVKSQDLKSSGSQEAPSSPV